MTAGPLPRLRERGVTVHLGPRRVAARDVRGADVGRRCVACPATATVAFDLDSGLTGHLCDSCFEGFLTAPLSRVYFIRAGDMVKIGHSTDVAARLKMHQTGSPVPLEVWHTELGGREQEAELHRMFAAYRAHGEWFRMSDAIREYVEAE